MISSDIHRFCAETDVSRETLADLQAYADLLVLWNKTINLVSPASLAELWRRHFLDSAQLFELVEPKGRWVDLGSGGGFPGLVIAVFAKKRSDLEVILVEVDQRKATFLRTVIRRLGLRARVVVGRIEELPPLEADVLSARALAPLDVLLGYASRHMKPTGVAIFPKGEKADAEIAEALEHWRFDCEKHPSQTGKPSTILRIGEIKRV